MRTNRNTIVEPVLMVDSHHGIYSYKIFMEQLNAHYKKQIPSELRKELRDVEGENYVEAWDEVYNITFKSPSGQKLFVHENDGDIWFVPAFYARTKAGQEFLQAI